MPVTHRYDGPWRRWCLRWPCFSRITSFVNAQCRNYNRHTWTFLLSTSRRKYLIRTKLQNCKNIKSLITVYRQSTHIISAPLKLRFYGAIRRRLLLLLLLLENNWAIILVKHMCLIFLSATLYIIMTWYARCRRPVSAQPVSERWPVCSSTEHLHLSLSVRICWTKLLTQSVCRSVFVI